MKPFVRAEADGCTMSVDWTRAQRECCLDHDEAYWYGGTSAARKAADVALYECWVHHGLPRWVASYRYYLVRSFGWWLWGRGQKTS
jgi:hypothetical protein